MWLWNEDTHTYPVNTLNLMMTRIHELNSWNIQIHSQNSSFGITRALEFTPSISFSFNQSLKSFTTFALFISRLWSNSRTPHSPICSRKTCQFLLYYRDWMKQFAFGRFVVFCILDFSSPLTWIKMMFSVQGSLDGDETTSTRARWSFYERENWDFTWKCI